MTLKCAARWLSLVWLGLALLLGASACSPANPGAAPQSEAFGSRPNPVPYGPLEPPTATAAPGTLALRILHTNDTSGEIDPCG